MFSPDRGAETSRLSLLLFWTVTQALWASANPEAALESLTLFCSCTVRIWTSSRCKENRITARTQSIYIMEQNCQFQSGVGGTGNLSPINTINLLSWLLLLMVTLLKFIWFSFFLVNIRREGTINRRLHPAHFHSINVVFIIPIVLVVFVECVGKPTWCSAFLFFVCRILAAMMRGGWTRGESDLLFYVVIGTGIY